MSTYNSERRTVLRGVALLALTVAGCQKRMNPRRQTPAPRLLPSGLHRVRVAHLKAARPEARPPPEALPKRAPRHRAAS